MSMRCDDDKNDTHLFSGLDELRMFVIDVLLYERSRFEKFLASFTPEFPFILLLKVRFNGFTKFTGIMSSENKL